MEFEIMTCISFFLQNLFLKKHFIHIMNSTTPICEHSHSFLTPLCEHPWVFLDLNMEKHYVNWSVVGMTSRNALDFIASFCVD